MVAKINQALTNAVGAVIVFLAGIWDTIPLGAQLVIRDIVVAVGVNVAALNLALPKNTTEATAETMLVITTVAYTAFGVIRREVWPYVVDWLLSKLDVYEKLRDNGVDWTLTR
jgi:hypothetical protein